jgi:hypothetical protein
MNRRYLAVFFIVAILIGGLAIAKVPARTPSPTPMANKALISTATRAPARTPAATPTIKEFIAQRMATTTAALSDEPSISCEDAIREGKLHAEIVNGTAIVENDANQPYTISLAAYRMYAASIDDQTLYSSRTYFLNPRDTKVLSVSVPECSYQIDVVCGNALNTRPRYEGRTIASAFGNQGAFCTQQQSGNVTVSIAPHYPKGTSYVFECNAQGFVPTQYSWYYGDSQYLLSTTRSDVYHTYQPGSYTVACTATDGQVSGTGTLSIVAQNSWPPVIPNATNTTTNISTNVTTNVSTNVSINTTTNVSINTTTNITTNISTNITTNVTTNVTLPTNVTNSTAPNSTDGNATNGTNSTGNSTAPGDSGSGNGGSDPGSNTGSGSGMQTYGNSAGSTATMGGYCNTGWHKENGICVRDAKPEPQQEAPTPPPRQQGLDLAQPVAAGPGDEKKDDKPLDLTDLNDQGSSSSTNGATGRVAGSGGQGVGWVWLIVLIGVVAVLGSIAAYLHIREPQAPQGKGKR